VGPLLRGPESNVVGEWCIHDFSGVIPSTDEPMNPLFRKLGPLALKRVLFYSVIYTCRAGGAKVGQVSNLSATQAAEPKCAPSLLARTVA